jgi:hypothetical protein
MRTHVHRQLWFTLSLIAVYSMASADLVPYDPETMLFPVSIDQAIQSARNWAGNQTLSVALNGVHVWPDNPLLPSDYVLATPGNAEIFYVNCNDGYLWSWLNPAVEAANSTKLAELGESAMLPTAQRSEMVRQFLLARYPDFEALSVQNVNPSVPDAIYMQRLPNGVWNGLNWAQCTIDEWSGDIYRYFAWSGGPPTITTDPTIDAAQAESIAVDYAGTLWIYAETDTVENVQIHPQSVFVLKNWGVFVVSDDANLPRLVYQIELIIHEDPGYTPQQYAEECEVIPSGQQITVVVDANTGEASEAGSGSAGGSTHADTRALAKAKARHPSPLHLKKTQPRYEKGWLRLDGISLDLNYPVFIVRETGYLYAKYLPIFYGGMIECKNGAVELNVAGRHITIHPGTPKVEIEGKVVMLDKPALIIAGRTYVPYQAVKPICGASATWDAESKVLSMTSGAVKRKAATGVRSAKTQ